MGKYTKSKSREDGAKFGGSAGRATSNRKRSSTVRKTRNFSKRGDSDNYSDRTVRNDVSWYAANAQLVHDVANFSFNAPTGVSVQTLLDANHAYNQALMPDSIAQPDIPGVMTYNVIPTFGIANNYADPLNIASRQIFAYVRAANSGSRNYDAPDLMMYLLAVDSCFSFYAWMLRTYGFVNSFKFFNRYTPKTLITAMGVDYASVSGDMARFRAYINLFAQKLTTLVVPRNLTLFDRHFQMFGNVYKDSDHPKAQYVMYNPEVFWKWKNDGETGSSLEAIPMREILHIKSITESTVGLLTLNDIINIGEEILAALDDEDIMIMGGDLLKAFGDANIWKQSNINEDFILEPVFNFDMLQQFQNVDSLNYYVSDQMHTSCPYIITQVIPSDTRSPYITASCVVNYPKASTARWYGYHADMFDINHLLISPYTSPTPEQVLESTRLIHGADMILGTNSDTLTITSCGAELVSNIQIFTFGRNEDAENAIVITPVVTREIIPAEDQTYTSAVINKRRMLTLISSFSFHPTIYQFVGADDAAERIKIDVPYADIDNFTTINDTHIYFINEAVLLSLLYVRNVGALSPR